jgi:antitoxin (DNA-binding transcriptional repressor) of toxin-antitoxin stability system
MKRDFGMSLDRRELDGKNSHVQKATISQLKKGLSAYPRMVRAGETVLVFDRDCPVACLGPVSGPEGVDERLLRLQAAGLVRLPERPVPFDLLSSPPPRAGHGMLEALIEDRSEDR